MIRTANKERTARVNSLAKNECGLGTKRMMSTNDEKASETVPGGRSHDIQTQRCLRIERRQGSLGNEIAGVGLSVPFGETGQILVYFRVGLRDGEPQRYPPLDEVAAAVPLRFRWLLTTCPEPSPKLYRRDVVPVD
jgi:hypothetical protein